MEMGFKMGFERYKNKLNKDIEDHKSELVKEIEDHKNRLLFDLQRKTHDFQLFTEKKHEKYAELYAVLYEATSLTLITTARIRTNIAYRNLIDEDLIQILESFDIFQTYKKMLYELLENNKKEELEEHIKRIKQNQELKNAYDLRLKGYNLFAESLIYLSSEVATVCKELLDEQKEYLIDYEIFICKRYAPSEKKVDIDTLDAHENKLIKLRERLLTLMKTELSIGYYEGVK
ncbi:hypothetical protein [Bacillus paralicheniformis]|uniref:hypothetical protein n=1 Tax=Bacillus paralicheniformis TaxID=1648923 RepID=UPI001CC7DE15|nr:hypothetical protein [Bacillus paralicheniformis]UAY69720.1 hypothetical protein K8336_17660 [Bacillus paralicheniformis]